MQRREFIGAALAAASTLALSDTKAAAADTFPDRPINYIVAFPPGSNTDVLGRLMAQKLGEALKVSVIVDNKPGATGMIGSAYVAKAAPDGYTLLGASIASHAINASMFKNMQYDVIKSFQPITIIGTNGNTLVVRNGSPFKSVADIIAAAKAKPGTLSFASSGIGTTQHLSGVLLEQLAGIKMVHVPYSSRSALPDIIGGQVDFMFEGPTVVPHVKGGTLRALAVTSPKRMTSLPDVPTMMEAGVAGYQVQAWQAIFGPAHMPAPILAKIYGALADILKTPAVVGQLHGIGVEPSGITPEEFARYQREEVQKWAAVVKAAGIAAS
jgi:tripartite-type tricarboxylate transporter receptor subunit TctC